MNKLDHDLVIVGAGPCGSFLAYRLATLGIKPLVLEKCQLPRDKTCAGGVTVRACSLFPFKIEECVEETIFGVRLSFKRRVKAVRTYPQPLAYMVSRPRFDAWLAARAAAAGATIQTGIEVRHVELLERGVKVTMAGGSLVTPLLVAADGATSAVVRSLGWKANFEYGVGVNGQVRPGPERLGEWAGLMGLDYGVAGGYAWVFPKADHLSVGAGGSLRVARGLRTYSQKLAGAYHLCQAGQPAMGGALMPVRRPGSPLSRGRIALVGDAAGVIDPLTGEGLYYGLRSSLLALPAILAVLRGDAEDLRAYDRALESELSGELKIARKIQKLNSLTPRIFFYWLQHNDRFWRAFCRLLRGEKTYASLRESLSPVLRRAFDLV